MSDINTRVIGWLLGDDTGLSSLTILSVMTGNPTAWTGAPRDWSDFGRCYRLLELVPEWRERLPEMAERYPNTWTGLVKHWGELTDLFESGRRNKLTQRIMEVSK